MVLNFGATVVIVVAIVCTTVLGLYWMDLKNRDPSVKNIDLERDGEQSEERKGI